MSKHDDPNGPYQSDANLPAKKTNTRDYDVGHGKPPKHSQFQKGQSGNKRGRPKGAKTKAKEGSLMKLVQQEAARAVVVNNGEEQLTLSISRTLLRTLSQKAAKGDVAAKRLFFKMLGKAEEVLNRSTDSVENKQRKLEILFIRWMSYNGIALTGEEVAMLRERRTRLAAEEALKPFPSLVPQALLEAMDKPESVCLIKNKDHPCIKAAESFPSSRY